MNRMICFGLALTAASLSQASLLVNGGFEEPGTTAWNFFHNGEVPGWRTADGSVMELGLASVYGVTGAVGRNVVELDSDRNVSVMQDVTLASGDYELSFLFARRGSNLDGRPADTSNFEVKWNNQVIGSFNPESPAMTKWSTVVRGLSGSNRLTFIGTGTSDAMGALIDEASLNPVPEPASILVLMAGIGLVKRRKSE